MKSHLSDRSLYTYTWYVWSNVCRQVWFLMAGPLRRLQYTMGFYNFTRRRYTLYGDHCPPAKSGMHGTGVFRKHNGWGTYCVYILGCIHSNCNVDTSPLNLLHCRHTALRHVQRSRVAAMQSVAAHPVPAYYIMACAQWRGPPPTHTAPGARSRPYFVTARKIITFKI